MSERSSCLTVKTSTADNGYPPSLWAIVPVKPLDQSKKRLAHLLPAEERIQLMISMLRRTLNVLGEASAVHSTLVVTSDEIVLSLARGLGAKTLDEGESHGLNDAIDRAVQRASSERATAALILPADLPLIRLDDVKRMLQGFPDGGPYQSPFMAICSDAAGDGTNALLLGLPTRFKFYYGPGSFSLHLQEAAGIGLSTWIMHSPGIEFDLDTEEDWETYNQRITHAIDV
jgi:2-phospho-L-lactate guanylyltransferase